MPAESFSVSGPLHLRGNLREHFLDWLHDYDAELHADYLRRYADGAYAPTRYVDELYRRAGIPRIGRRITQTLHPDARRDDRNRAAPTAVPSVNERRGT